MRKVIIFVIATWGLHTESIWIMLSCAAYVLIETYLEIKKEE